MVKEYVKLAVDSDNYVGNSKYCLTKMMHRQMDSLEGKKLLAASSMEDVW